MNHHRLPILVLLLFGFLPQISADDVRVSDRTLLLGVQVDRHEARLLSYTVKERPYIEPALSTPVRAYETEEPLQLEVTLLGPAGARKTIRKQVGPLCLEHEPGMPAHVQGDTIQLHRDAYLIAVPALAGFDVVEVSYYRSDRGLAVRELLAREPLDASRFVKAGGRLEHHHLDLAPAEEPPSVAPEAATVIWPEDFADPDLYRIDGNAAEGALRLNIVIVPDGYTYAQKALMEQHADDMVQHLRQKTPYKEHDALINYTLVYAYSVESGTDQCDCSIVVDTAMGTRFPTGSTNCQNSANRCLSYGGGCDTSGFGNIVAAEQRAPYHDETIIMVNTTRYGGCAGSRSTYSAGNPSGEEVAAHELGHSVAGLADEYTSNSGCGAGAGNVNTSTDGTDGAWAEWISEIGAPREGAQYWTQCVYRPESNCAMRALNQPFCAVCNQRWSNVFFGASQAPIESSTVAPAQIVVNTAQSFAVTNRFAVGPAVTNEITWTITGPGFPVATEVATGTDSYNHLFDQVGNYTVACEVIADTNFVKPEKYGANVNTAEWNIEVVPTICEVGCAEGLPQCDADNDGIGDICDPCPAQSLNHCFGPVALDNSAAVNIRVNTDAGSTSSCSGNRIDCRGTLWLADFGMPGFPSGYNQLGDALTCDLAQGCPVDASAVFGCTDAETEALARCGHADSVGAPELNYSFDVPDGAYLVNLLFMNGSTATTTPGSRIYSVEINGEVPVQLDDFDPVTAAAPGAPVVRSTEVQVSGGGGMSIRFLESVERPMIQGIEVLCAESVWYRDFDQDGFGDPATTSVACYQPAGHVADATDCLDTDANSYPGGAEICDGVDNDCDTVTDGDGDQDGFDVCADCDDALNYQWAVPDEITDLIFPDPVTLTWTPSSDPGGFYPIVSVLRAPSPDGFAAAGCVGQPVWFAPGTSDQASPPPGGAFFYLLRPEGFCGAGTLGLDSTGAERQSAVCPFPGDGTGGNGGQLPRRD